MKRLWASFGYAGAGLWAMVKSEPNARVHLALTAVVLSAGAYVGLSASDWRWIVLAIGLVWSGEALNTALEALCDAVHPDQHPLIKRTKDIGAGAVLILASAAAGIGILTFWPYVMGG